MVGVLRELESHVLRKLESQCVIKLIVWGIWLKVI